jgi:fatty-acyl-CoA synthase
VYPAEIEQALAGFLGVADCAVIGVPDEKWGEVGHVFVTGVGVTPAAVLAFLEGRLARYKIPKFVTVMEALPRNAAGKLVKARLREVLGG